MGRIRTVKPEFFYDEELSALSAEAHLLAAGLLTYADDFGYFNANPRLIRASIFPLREFSGEIPESSGIIPEMLRSLSGIGYIRLGVATDGKLYGHIVKFTQHQRVSHPTPSKIATLSVTWESSGEFPEDSGNLPNDSALKGKERNREQGSDPAEEISSSMVASSVLDDLRLSGQELRIVLDDICRMEMKAGASADNLRASGERLEGIRAGEARIQLRVGPKAFFGEGHWRSNTGWPWKDGFAPASRPIPVKPDFERPDRTTTMDDIRAKLMAKGGAQ